MPLLLGENNIKELYLGASKVDKIYLGTQLVYQSFSELRLYWSGYQPGITWQINNLPRPQYTTYANGSLEHAADGYMLLYISDTSSSAVHNAHVITQQAIEIPTAANYLHVNVKRGALADQYLTFGMLPSNAPNSYDTSRGGFLSNNINVRNASSWTEYTLAIPDNAKGTNNLRAIVNFRGQADSRKDLRIGAVWLTR